MPQMWRAGKVDCEVSQHTGSHSAEMPQAEMPGKVLSGNRILWPIKHLPQEKVYIRREKQAQKDTTKIQDWREQSHEYKASYICHY